MKENYLSEIIRPVIISLYSSCVSSWGSLNVRSMGIAIYIVDFPWLQPSSCLSVDILKWLWLCKQWLCHSLTGSNLFEMEPAELKTKVCFLHPSLHKLNNSRLNSADTVQCEVSQPSGSTWNYKAKGQTNFCPCRWGSSLPASAHPWHG